MPKFVSSGAREFTNFMPNCSLNKFLQEKYNVNNSHEFRHYLQANAEQIMKDLADCNPKPDCVFCPVCKKALMQ